MVSPKPQVDSLAALDKPAPLDTFWSDLTLDQLAAQQKIEPVSNLDEFCGSWPEDDSVDEFLESVRQGRA